MKYMIIWSLKREYFSQPKGMNKTEYTDDYSVVDNIEEAQRQYDVLLDRDDLYIATIATVIESTDYDTHPLLKTLKRKS